MSLVNTDMKINSKFKLRKIAGETIIVNQGISGANLTRIISLNESASLLYEELAEKEFTITDVENILKSNYEVDDTTAAKDSAAWVEALKKCCVITD